MNGAWGYEVSKEGSYRSAQSLVRELVQVASRNGNYLLNIGPKRRRRSHPRLRSTR